MHRSVFFPRAIGGAPPTSQKNRVVVTLRCLLHHGPARLERLALGGLVFAEVRQRITAFEFW
jgi:hypothetical protein